MSQDEYNRNSMDAVLSRIETKLDDALKTQKSHGERLTELEKWRYYVLGAFAAAGAGMAAAWKFITSK